MGEPKLMSFPIKLDFVRVLTDDVGILQHSKYATPNRKEGYTTDDNARALIACANYLTLLDDSSVQRLIDTYLSLLFFMQRSDGKMHNYLLEGVTLILIRSFCWDISRSNKGCSVESAPSQIPLWLISVRYGLDLLECGCPPIQAYPEGCPNPLLF